MDNRCGKVASAIHSAFLPGCRPLTAPEVRALADFKRHMSDVAIPEICRTLGERAAAAAANRYLPLR